MSTDRYLGVDPMLTNVAIGYSNDDYVAEMLLPSFPVLKQSGKHFVYDRGRFRNNPTKRGAGAASNETSLILTTGNPYFAEDHAQKMFVPDEDVQNAITPTDPFQDATEFVTDQVYIDREIEMVSMLTATATMTQNTTLSGTSQWSDFSNSDPIANIRTGKQTIHNAVHKNPNTLVMGRQVWDKLIDHPAIVERIKYTQFGSVTTDVVARLFEVDRVIIASAGKNTAKEGQTDSMSYIWGKDALLCYVAPRIQPKMITLGLTYTWNQLQVERLRGSTEEDRKGTYVRIGNWYFDQNTIAVACGYLVKGAVA